MEAERTGESNFKYQVAMIQLTLLKAILPDLQARLDEFIEPWNELTNLRSAKRTESDADAGAEEVKETTRREAGAKSLREPMGGFTIWKRQLG